MSAGVVLTMAAIMLSGCNLIGDGGTVIGFLGEDAANADLMRVLLADLEALPGVEDAEGTFTPTDDEPGPSVTVTATEAATAEELAGVVDRVTVDYAVAWKVYASRLVIATSPGSRLNVTDFTRSESAITADIVYWQAVERAIGAPIELMINQASANFTGRVFTAPPADVEAAVAFFDNYDAFLAVAPPPRGTIPIFLPGFTSAGDLPPARYAEVAGQIARIGAAAQPVGQDAAVAGFQWSSRDDAPPGAVYSLAIPGVEYSPDGTGNAGWGAIVAAAGVIVENKLERVTFTFLLREDPVVLHLGDCADEPAPGAPPDVASAELLPTLVAAGVELPADAAPGFCQLWNAS